MRLPAQSFHPARTDERRSRRREAIRRALAEAAGPMTISEILAAARLLAPGLGQATVYRAIKRLQETGTICAVILPSRDTRYELADRRHHDYFHCGRCGRVFVFTRARGVRPPGRIPRGFQARGHELTIFGLCPDCGPSGSRGA